LEAHRVERKLSAIFAADVEGYSRLMGQDEVGTLRTLTAYRVIIDHLIASHRGRIFTTAGDSVLADFASAVDAVECAVEVQEAVGKENADRPAGEQMRFRIGIHVGDIIVQGDNLFGDAVNIAARLEALAEPGGICVSGTVQDHIGTKLPVGFIDIGEQQVKNITQPIKAYRIRGETSPTAAQVVGTSLPLPDKPSIAVLPFANMSGDPDQEYFADGMVEEIITALSRIRWLFVIARNSSFTYKGHAVDVKQVGRELGVRYVLEGSVRKAGGRVRITGQLINATTGTHIWADRFDGSLADVFDLQDQIATSVAVVIEPTLRQAEIERARRKRPDSLDAYDLYLRALPFAYTSMPEDADKALGYLEQAIRLDADFAVVHAIIAWCHEQRYLRGGLDESAKAIALRHAHLAIAMGGDDPTALAIAGLVTGFLEPREYDVAVSAFDRALTLSNSSALALGFSAVTRAWHAESTIAIEQAERALRLSPLFDPLSKERHMAIAIAHFVAGRFEESASAASRAIQANPRFSPPYWMRCAALASLGRIDEAEAVAEQLLKVQPQFTIGSIISAPFAKREILGALGDALRRVGLPE
jgi:adenylate cyclase